jgi:hypothetical protein
LEKARVHKVHARRVPHIRGLYMYALRQYLYFCTKSQYGKSASSSGPRTRSTTHPRPERVRCVSLCAFVLVKSQYLYWCTRTPCHRRGACFRQSLAQRFSYAGRGLVMQTEVSYAGRGTPCHLRGGCFRQSLAPRSAARYCSRKSNTPGGCLASVCVLLY